MKKIKPVLLIVLALCAAALIFLAVRPESVNEPNGSEGNEKREREIVALVNGREIYADEIDKELATVPPESRKGLSGEDALNFIITRKLLLIASEEEGVVVNSREIENLYGNYAGLFGRNDTLQLIAEQGFTPEEFAERMAEQAAINALMDKKRAEYVVVKREEVQQEYELNYAQRNVSLEDVEKDIVLAIAEKKKKDFPEAYVKGLMERARITLLVPTES